MEGFLDLSSRLFWGWENFPYIGHIHTASIGEDPFILGAWIVWWSFKKIHFTNLKKKVGTSPPKHLFPPFFCSFFCSWVIGFFVPMKSSDDRILQSTIHEPRPLHLPNFITIEIVMYSQLQDVTNQKKMMLWQHATFETSHHCCVMIWYRKSFC